MKIGDSTVANLVNNLTALQLKQKTDEEIWSVLIGENQFFVRKILRS